MLYALIALATATSSPVDRALPAPAATTPQAEERTPAMQARPTNYCVVRTPTGSHLRLKTCHTRQEWLDLGFDPTARNR